MTTKRSLICMSVQQLLSPTMVLVWGGISRQASWCVNMKNDAVSYQATTLAQSPSPHSTFLSLCLGSDCCTIFTQVGKQPNDEDTIYFSFSAPVVKGFTTGYIGKVALKPYAVNGPAEGGHELTIFGSNFGVLDYSPRVFIGDSACRAKAWVSDTSIYCTTAKATLFLAGANEELALRVQVGLEHYPRSFQEGIYTRAYYYDPVIIRSFKLGNTEINFIAFTSAFVLSGAVIIWMQQRYVRFWPSIPPALAIQRAKNRGGGAQRANKSKLWPASHHANQHRHHKIGDEDQDVTSHSNSEAESDDFYEIANTRGRSKNARTLEEAFAAGMAAGTAILHEPNDDFDQEQGRSRPLLLHTNKFYLPQKPILKLEEKADNMEEDMDVAADKALSRAEAEGFSGVEAMYQAALDLEETREVSTARVDEVRAHHAIGPGGIPIGWSKLSTHVGDVPESVSSPAETTGGGGRTRHHELMQRARRGERIIRTSEEVLGFTAPQPPPGEPRGGTSRDVGARTSEVPSLISDQYGPISGVSGVSDVSDRFGPISSISDHPDMDPASAMHVSDRFGPISGISDHPDMDSSAAIQVDSSPNIVVAQQKEGAA